MIVDIDEEEFTVRLYHYVKDTKPYASIGIDELIEAWERVVEIDRDTEQMEGSE